MCLVFAGGVVWALVYLLLNARISIESCHGATELTFRIGYLFPIIKLSDINSSNLDYKLYILVNYQFPLFGFNHEIFRLLYYVSCLTAHSNEYPLKLASYKLLRASMLAAYPKTPLLFCTWCGWFGLFPDAASPEQRLLYSRTYIFCVFFGCGAPYQVAFKESLFFFLMWTWICRGHVSEYMSYLLQTESAPRLQIICGCYLAIP